MKPQDAPLVTGYALACVVLFVLLSITGFQVDAIIRAGFIPARFGSELILPPGRSEEHTSELQSLRRISYAVFCLNTKKIHQRLVMSIKHGVDLRLFMICR